MCKTWLYERSPVIPPNIYVAQLQLRRGAAGVQQVLSS